MPNTEINTKKNRFYIYPYSSPGGINHVYAVERAGRQCKPDGKAWTPFFKEYFYKYLAPVL